MKRMTRNIAMCMALVFGAGLMTAGCGHSNSTAASGTSGASSSGTSAAAAASSESVGSASSSSTGSSDAYVTANSYDSTAAVDDNSDAKEMQIALDANVSPYTYTDDDGNPAGYDYEVLKLIDAMLPQYKFSYNVVDYDAAAIGLEQGQYDLEAGDKYDTSARQKKFYISDSDYYAGVSIAVKKDSGISSIEDLYNGGTLVPVPEADGLRQVYLDYMKEHPDCGIVQETGSSLISIADGLNYVAAGRYDAMIDSPDMFKEVLDQDKDLASEITVLDPFTVVGGHFLINRNDKEFCADVNGAVAALIKDGTLGKLSEKWFGEDVFTKYADIAAN